MRSLRPLVLAGVLGAGTVLAACSSSPDATRHSPGNPGIGASLAQVQNFFEKQGGGNFHVGQFTGGLVGYAVNNANGQCPVSLSGITTNINNIRLFCNLAGPVSTNPQQAQSIITATVDRFAPQASSWIRTELQTDLASSSNTTRNSKKKAGSNAVLLTRAPGQSGQVTLVIEPYQLSLPPPGQTTTTTPQTTTTTQ
jgi:hypothetical protein